MDIFRRYFPTYRTQFLVAVLCVALEAVCDLLCPTFMARIIDYGIQQQSLPEVWHWGRLMLLATAFGAIFATLRNVLAGKVSQSFGADLRHDLFKKTLSLSTESADHIQPGSLITRMTGDVTQVTQMVNGTMRVFIKAPVTCLGSIILATLLSWRLSLIIYAVVALVIFLIIQCMRTSYPRFRLLQQAMDHLNTRVEEYLLGIRLVKAFGTEKEERRKFGTDNDALRTTAVQAQRPVTLLSPLLTLIVGLGTVLVLFWGSRLFSLSMTNAGDISAFTIYMAQMLSSLLMITNIFNIFVRTKASLERIDEVMQAPDDVSTIHMGKVIHGAITCNHLDFSYPEGSGTMALDDITFHLEPGASLAVIGPTGSGKSTLAWLLLRMYEVKDGMLQLDGNPISAYGTDEVRHAISLVPQKPSLFTGTVRENLTWGAPQATDDAVKDAIDIADAAFLYDIPGGLEGRIDAGGANLSGGQKQRIAIIRAILRNTPILILDDATSALDALTATRVQQALLSRSPRPTTLLITQRCSTAISAERILVLENGKQMGLGSHAQLLASCPVYQDIWQTQNGGLYGDR